MRYRVFVTNYDATASAGPGIIEADTPEQARELFALNEGWTLEQFRDAGLSWWSVASIPQDAIVVNPNPPAEEPDPELEQPAPFPSPDDEFYPPEAPEG